MKTVVKSAILALKVSLCYLLLGAFLGLPSAQGAGIFNSYEHADGDYRPSLVYEEDRTIAGHLGLNETLSFRLNLYGAPGADLPLLVQVHEWGGNFQRQEDIASYVPRAYSFVMLSFQYKPATGNEDDWWFGTRWGGECRLWAHQAVMNIVREAVNTSLIPDHLPGVTVDPNRVYLFGSSIGGTGAWQLGVRNPEVFAAVHAHSGFARFTPPVGPFQEQFENDIVGGPGDGIIIRDPGGHPYPARDYANLAWWLSNYRQPAWETPFVAITAGMADDVVPAASGGDLMQPVFDTQKRGFFYLRHPWGHSDECFVQMNWLANFRRNQSFLAFTNRSGYGVEPPATGMVNDLYAFSWDPASIVDQTNHYEVLLVGSGTADVTLRRLQRFRVLPNRRYRYWITSKTGPGTAITASPAGLLTIPQRSGGQLLIVEPEKTTVMPLTTNLLLTD
ncbi:MAG: alpha/beta hydrolase-fold protein [Thermodesulfobacteriota bacterium]